MEGSRSQDPLKYILLLKGTFFLFVFFSRVFTPGSIIFLFILNNKDKEKHRQAFEFTEMFVMAQSDFSL